MELSDLGYKFHGTFAPVGLSAFDAADSSVTDESIFLVEILSDTLNKLVANAYAFSEDNKSHLETQHDDYDGISARIDYEAH